MKQMTRRAAGWVTGSLLALLLLGDARGQDFAGINAALFRSYHTNLFVGPNQSRGFTSKTNASIVRVPAGGHDGARNYILSSLLQAGLPAKLNPFVFTTNFGGPTYVYSNCNNIVALMPGADPAAYGTFIVSAFYDTIDRGQPLPVDFASGPAPKSPGADLNASGVAAVLCIARTLARQRYMANILFVFFDASEKNFGGSSYFIDKKTSSNPLKTTKLFRGNIRFMISLDTIGYNPPGMDHDKAAIWGGAPAPSDYRRKLGKALVRQGGLGVVQGGTIISSDHVPFWEAGIDSCVVSECNIWNNPYIYTPYDCTAKTGYMDNSYAASIARGVAVFLHQQARMAPNAPARQP